MEDIKIYRDAPKRGETDSKWCGYVVKHHPVLGSFVARGTTGHDTPEAAKAALIQAA
jgi:hypothetical protein